MYVPPPVTLEAVKGTIDNILHQTGNSNVINGGSQSPQSWSFVYIVVFLFNVDDDL